jgi:AcrR family transcriptional regulator
MSRVPAERPGKIGGARDRNRTEKSDKLARAALTLFLKRGLDAVTIDDIVEKADFSKGSFYRYFKDKEHLVEYLLDPIGDIFRAAAVVLYNSPPELLEGAYFQMAMTLGRAVFSHPDVVRLYLQECRGPAAGARKPVRKLADEIAYRAVELGRTARATGRYKDMDTRVVTLAIIGAGERLLYEHLTIEPFADPFGVGRALVELINDGLRPR